MNRTTIWRCAPLGLLLLLASRPAGAAALELGAALEEALAHSPSLKAGAEEIHLAEARRQGAIARLLPLLSAQASFTRSDDQVFVFGSKLRQGNFSTADFALPTLNQPDSLNNWQMGLSLYAPLWASGRNWRGKEAAEFEKLSVESRVLWHRRALRLAVTAAYLTLGSHVERARTLREGIGRLVKLEENYKLLRAPNSATTASYLVSRSIRFALEGRLDQVESGRLVAWAQLAELIGRPSGSEIPEVAPPQLPALPAAAGAPPRRDDQQALLYARQALDLSRSAKKGLFGPELGFFAGYAFNTGDFEEGEDAYNFGVALTWELFNYGSYALQDEARAQRRQIDWQIRAQEEGIGREEAESRARLQGLLNQHGRIEAGLASAEEALKFAGQRYREGSLPLKDLSEAIRNWVEVRLAQAEVCLGAAAARAEYDFVRGG